MHSAALVQGVLALLLASSMMIDHGNGESLNKSVSNLVNLGSAEL